MGSNPLWLVSLDTESYREKTLVKIQGEEAHLGTREKSLEKINLLTHWPRPVTSRSHYFEKIIFLFCFWGGWVCGSSLGQAWQTNILPKARTTPDMMKEKRDRVVSQLSKLLILFEYYLENRNKNLILSDFLSALKIWVSIFWHLFGYSVIGNEVLTLRDHDCFGNWVCVTGMIHRVAPRVVATLQCREIDTAKE